MDNDEKDINPHELIKKHIDNKDHIVTDEELDNMKIGEDAIPEEELKKEAEQMEDEINQKPHVPNPYDVL